MIREVLESRLDALGKALQVSHKELAEELARIESQTHEAAQRVHDLEIAQAKTRGAIAMASLLVPAITGLIVVLIMEVLTK